MVAGKVSVDESPELPFHPPVMRSRFGSMGEPKDCQLSTNLIKIIG